MRAGTELWLVRHGETGWNREGRLQGHTDVKLDARGGIQAQRAAQRLQAYSFAGIYASDLQRAARTAEIIAQALEQKVCSIPELREIDVGKLGGLTIDDARTHQPECFREGRATDFRPAGGESHMEHMERVWEALLTAVGRHEGERIMAVTHGGSIRAALKRAMGLPLEYQLRVTLGNTSLTVLAYRRDSWYLELLNDTCHLRADVHKARPNSTG